MGDTTCVVCGTRPAAGGHVCDLDLLRIGEQLADLPRKIRALDLALAPANAPGGQRVSQSGRTGSPAPARLDALSLIGPGSDRTAALALATMTHPRVRRWRTVEHVTVCSLTGGERDIELVTWHQELYAHRKVAYSASRGGQLTHAVRPRQPSDPPPVGQLHNDQVGLVPPLVWLRSWARRWRRMFGHHQPDISPASSADERVWRAWLAREHTAQAAAQREAHARALLALDPYIAPGERPGDPLGQAWQLRFGPAGTPLLADQDWRYLLTWLHEACRREQADLGGFAAGLRALSEELVRVLGERPDQQWIGRCPTPLVEHETGLSHPCGAGMWQDPYASQVACTRCRSVWGPSRLALLQLAVQIRKTWPVDRRRRYTTDEVDGLVLARPLKCPACAAAVKVLWVDVTGQGDKQRFWKPTQTLCPHGCPDGGRIL